MIRVLNISYKFEYQGREYEGQIKEMASAEGRVPLHDLHALVICKILNISLDFFLINEEYYQNEIIWYYCGEDR